MDASAGPPPCLIVPGLGGSGPDHWQTRWETCLPHVARVVQRDWDRPDRDAWIEALVRAVREAPAPVVLVAHSLGCAVVAHAAARDPGIPVRAALLVAPADVDSPAHAWSFAFDVGGGFEWDIPDLPGFGLGPYLRYGLVSSPDPTASGPGQAWTLGGSFTYHFGRAAEGAARSSSEPSHHATTRPFRLSIPDTDHDGVADDEDQCKDIPQGKHPDPFRPGCPEADEDNDGIPDVDDQCPGDPPGDHPDPKRPGCPFVDSDLDGIADEDDACPLKPGPASEDRAKNGCPTGKKARVEEPEEENTPRPNTDESPKPVHKRGM